MTKNGAPSKRTTALADDSVSTPDVEAAVARERLRAKLFPSHADPYKVGRYMVRRTVGHGGMGLVLSAYDPQLDRDVALKIVREGAADSEDAQGRLLREARAIAKLQHPHVVSVFDCGVHEGRVFIAMELIDGAPLYQWLEMKRRRWREIVDIFLQAGEGLWSAHQAGLVHRDFKPGNFLITTDREAKVVDFGLALSGVVASVRAGGYAFDVEETRRGTHAAGTPAYMSPEQFAGATVDARSDQFSFCACLFESLFGPRPFTGETFEEIGESLLTEALHFPEAAALAPTSLKDVLAQRTDARAAGSLHQHARAARRSRGSGGRPSPMPWSFPSMCRSNAPRAPLPSATPPLSPAGSWRIPTSE